MFEEDSLKEINFSSLKSGKAAWKEGGVYMRKGAKYVEKNYGDLFQNIWDQTKAAFGIIWSVSVRF